MRNNMDPLRYVINDVYRYKQKRNIISSDNCDNKGLLDSLKLLFDNYTRENVMFANILLKAFQHVRVCVFGNLCLCVCILVLLMIT